MVAFGWHMHPLYDLRYDFPYHPNVRPLFLSFHVNRLDMLSDAAQAYLRSHGPIGCRDWNTVFLLLSAGIDAFFTGCLTTTVDARVPRPRGGLEANGAVGVIDLPQKAPGAAPGTSASTPTSPTTYRTMSLVDGVRAAIARLTDYQRELDRAVTGRLHAYLPLTSLGVPVEFRIASPGDVRFAGLTDLHPGDARLDAMRDDIRDLVAAAVRAVLSGARGRRSTPVARAHPRARRRGEDDGSRRRSPSRRPPSMCRRRSRPAGRAAGGSGRTRPSTGRRHRRRARVRPEPHVPGGGAHRVHRWRTRPARCACGCSVAGCPRRYPDWLAAAFPSLPITFLPCDQISYGPERPPAPHPGADHDLDDGPAAPAVDARRRRPGRLPRRRHADARRRLPRSHGPTSAAGRSPRATRTSARPANGDAPDATSRSRRPPTCDGRSGRRARLRAPRRSTPASWSWTSPACGGTASRRRRSAGSSTTGSTTRTRCSPTPGRNAPRSIRAGTRCRSSRTSTTRASSTGPASASPGSRP